MIYITRDKEAMRYSGTLFVVPALALRVGDTILTED